METRLKSRGKIKPTSTCVLCFALSSQNPVTQEEFTRIQSVLGPLVPDVAGILEESSEGEDNRVFCGECDVLLKEAARIHLNLQNLNAQLISVLVSVKSKIVDKSYEIKVEVESDEEVLLSDSELPKTNNDTDDHSAFSPPPSNFKTTTAVDSSPQIRRSPRKNQLISRVDKEVLEEQNLSEVGNKSNESDEEYQPSDSDDFELPEETGDIPETPEDNHSDLIIINKSSKRKRQVQILNSEDEDVPRVSKKSKQHPKFVCTVCSINFRCKGDKLNHCESLHFKGASEDVEGMCRLYSRICGKSSMTPADLSRHNETFHESSLKFKCDECDKKFTSPGLLNAHRPTHSELTSFPCSLCLPKSVTFDTPVLLNNHILRVHVHAQKMGEMYKSHRVGPQCDNPLNARDKKCRWCEFKPQKGLCELNNHQRKSHIEHFSFICTHDGCNSTFSEESHRLTCVETHKDSPGPFNCFVCNITCPSGAELKEHLSSEHTVGGFKCVECPEAPLSSTRRYFSATILRGHMAHHHGREWPHKCPICAKGYLVASTLADHIRSAHNNRDNLDSVPGESSTRKSEHSRGKKGKKCEWCDFKSQKGLFDLNQHQRKSHPEYFTFICTDEDCSSSFLKESHARTCVETHRDFSGPFNCLVCHITCPSGADLKEHLASQHTVGGVKCDGCPEGPLASSKRYSGASRLRMHKARQHGGEWPHKCPFCPKGFDSPSTLADHLRSAHNNETLDSIPQWVDCKDCRMKFKTLNALKTHRKIAHSGLSTECVECGKTIVSRNGMNLHMRMHRGIKDHVCQFCGKGFVNPAFLKVHLRTHTGEKPYACHICGKTFSQSSVRTKHFAHHKQNGTWKEKPSETS